MQASPLLTSQSEGGLSAEGRDWASQLPVKPGREGGRGEGTEKGQMLPQWSFSAWEQDENERFPLKDTIGIRQ